ncbi:MAG: cytochrome c biogenesis protein CcsA [Deltaproteobacteria bacterium]
MTALSPIIASFTKAGSILLLALVVCSLLLGLSGLLNLVRPEPFRTRGSSRLLLAVNILFLLGFGWIAWFHYEIHQHIALELPKSLAQWLNARLAASNQGAAYGLPLYDPAAPPRYNIPLWIENEKYYFWFMCYGLLAMVAVRKLTNHRFQGAVYLLLAVQVAILQFVANPFTAPLPRFLAEVAPWFGPLGIGQRLGLFMKLYPRMVFYYNASYMWLHPPLLFLSYACITLFFSTSVLMLFRRELAVEALGYDFAKLGYFMLTLGMLLGYPWALQAWGPNWWWDPKICSSIMMWAVFSTYLHTRLYANKRGMWYFSSVLGIVSFLAMIFTFIASFLFPGEHTFQ